MEPTQNMGGQQQDPLQGLLQSLPPEVLAQILAGGQTDPQAALLEQQQAQAHALRMQKPQAYGAPAGMASGLNNVLEGVQAQQIAGRQQQNVDQRQQSLQALVAALRGGGGAP